MKRWKVKKGELSFDRGSFDKGVSNGSLTLYSLSAELDHGFYPSNLWFLTFEWRKASLLWTPVPKTNKTKKNPHKNQRSKREIHLFVQLSQRVF